MDLTSIDKCFKPESFNQALSQRTVLVADLFSEKARTETINEAYLSKYIGGPALGLRLWAQYCTEEDSSPVVIVPGSLCTSGLSFTDNLSVVFKSPQNGQVITHTFSSDFAFRLASCGFRAVVLTGRARRYSYVQITLEGAEICLTEQFTHLSTSKIESMFSNEDTSIICTGPASEVFLPYSCAVSNGRSTGRGGLGTALARKNVRVVAVKNNEELPKHVVSVIDERVSKSKTCQDILKHGTECFVEDAAIKGWAPVKNYSFRTDPRLFHLYACETERRLGGCLDKRIGLEEILSLGPQCGCFDISKIKKRYRYCIDLGIDPVSAGTVLGSIGENLTDDSEVLSILEDLSASVEMLSDNAYRINGLECGACDYRGSFASALNASLGNTEPVYFDVRHNLCTKDENLWVALNEDLVSGLSSLGFEGELIIHSLIDTVLKKGNPQKAVKVFGKTIFEDNMPKLDFVIELGSRAWRLKTEINYRNNVAKPCLPDHFCTDPDSNCKSDYIVPFFKLIESYRKFRDNMVVRQDAQAE